ncbi:MAG: protein translocase subunit SecD [Planctomycetes bacterium]|nr:protein translocase subunit SecD [Planctomycetota bacterium]
MLENARRQLMLVVVLAVAAIALLSSLGVCYGLDLKGGTQLIYEMDIDEAKAQGLIPESASEEQVGQIVDETVGIISERIDPTGQLEANVVRRGEAGILIELPEIGEEDARLIQSRIESLGRLEFRMVAYQGYDKDGVTFDLADESQRLKTWLEEPTHRDLVREDPQAISVFNALPADSGGPKSDALRWYPHLVEPSVDNEAVWGRSFALMGLYDSVQAFDATEFNGGRIPESMLALPKAERRLVEFVPVNMHETHFEGEHLDVSAIRATLDDQGRPAIAYRMREDKLDAYADWSDEFTGQSSAIILNGEVDSAPRFINRIYGNAQITGDFTKREVDSLVQTLRTGALQVRPKLQSRDVIGATLGQRSIDLAMISIGVGALLVLLFIIAYYRLAGLVAFMGLALNILLLLGVVAAFRTTLTLPGLAGLVLTMGMAVDSNILIYERIREEVARGKELLQACRAGFERAIVTIVDANITTFIAGLVLYNVGIGPIRGFALTLMFGIATTLFTAFFVSRLVFHYLLEYGRLREFRVSRWLADVNIDFMTKARTWLAISVVVIIAGLVAFASVPNDVKYAIDFTGGGNLKVALRDPISAQNMRDLLAADTAFRGNYPEPIVNTVGDVTDGKATRFSIRIKLTDAQRTRIDVERADNPTNYQPPYVRELRRVLSSRLVDAPFDHPAIDEDPDNSVRNFASIDLHFDGPVRASDLKHALRALGGLRLSYAEPDRLGIEVPEEQSTTAYRVEWDVPKEVTADTLFQDIQLRLGDATLATAAGQPVQLSDPIPESSEIGGRLVGELRNKAITALVVALGAIVLYIRVRFHEFSYGIAAVLALVHDVLVTLGVVVAANWAGLVDCEIDLALIAAFLTIIGYSINDTIVIFDRVRENLQEHARLGERIDTKEVFNTSINQTLSRTVLTTGTTMMVIVSQFVVNYHAGTALEGFSFALVIGMISGTYSTVFIASPIVNWLWKREAAKHGGHLPVSATAGVVSTTDSRKELRGDAATKV